MSWTIDVDHITTDEDCLLLHVPTRVGAKGYGLTVTKDTPGAQRFRLYDDDGELYYEGWLVEDDECPYYADAWMSALSFGAWDAGCTDIRDADGKSIIG